MKYLFLYSCIVFLVCVVSTEAATLIINSPKNAQAGEVFAVDIIFDTEGQMINSVDMSLAVSATNVRFLGYQENESLVKLWIKKPTLSRGVVTFAGSIPGGIGTIRNATGSSTKIPLVRFLFTVENPQGVIFSMPQSTVLLHDGTGAALLHTRTSSTTRIVRSSGAVENFETFSAKDTTPPGDITVEFYEASLFDRTPSILYFNATDEDSGIASYDILIGGKRISGVESPFVVPKKLAAYNLTLIAYDVAGNTATAVVQVPGTLSLFSLLALFVIVAAGFWLHTMVKKKI